MSLVQSSVSEHGRTYTKEDSLRRSGVSNTLYERLFIRPHYLSKGRGEDLVRIDHLPSAGLRTYFAHGHRDAVVMAFGISHQVAELVGIGGVVAVPDIIQETFA